MLLLLVGTVLCVAGFSEAAVCREDTECAADECCYIEPEFLVVSRRQLELGLLPANRKQDTGICEKYRLYQDSCGPLEVANGHCGCEFGFSCQWVPDPDYTTPVPRGKRAMVYHPEPGSYQCAPNKN